MHDAGTTEPFDIAVVGAGMVGAALALGLAQQGWRVALIEKMPPSPVAPGSAPDLRVSALNTHSETLLRNLGAWPEIEASRLAPFTRLMVWEALKSPLLNRDRPLNEICFEARALGQAQFGHIVENPVTQWALWSAILEQSNIQRFCPDGLAALHSRTDGIDLALTSGATLTAALVVGADGAESQVRTLAGIGIHREQYDQQALVTTVVHDGPPQDATWQAFSPTGPRAYLPLPAIAEQSWASLVWYDSPARIAQLKQLEEAEFIAALQAAFPSRLPRLRQAPARASFGLAKMQAQSYWRGRVVLVGDAAHTINPLAGQGVNLGFEDVECLLALLGARSDAAQADPADPALLARYQSRRRPASQRMIWLMDLFYHTFSNTAPPLVVARNLGLIAAERLPFGKEWVARYAMGAAPLPPGLGSSPGSALAVFNALPWPPSPGQLLAKLRPRKSPVKPGRKSPLNSSS